MKRMLKILLSMGMLIAIMCNAPVKAEYEDSENRQTGYVVFDLDGGDQSETIYDKNGNPIVISMTSVDGKQKSITNGNKLISGDSLLLSASFVVTVSNQKFTAVSNGKYSARGISVDNTSLRLNSSALATYTLQCSTIFNSYQMILSARIQNGDIVISFS